MASHDRRDGNPLTVCVICGKKFKPYHYRNYCCSEECIKERKRRTNLIWYDNNREKAIRKVQIRRKKQRLNG